MILIAAVYDDWGLGRDGTQPVALSADRKFFRETIRGAAVIVGRRTMADFPGGRPLPGRKNFVLSRTAEVPGAVVCRSPAEAAQQAAGEDRVFVIGGGSVYRQMLPYCDTAYVTKVHVTVPCDTWLPDLDTDPGWRLCGVMQQGEENGIAYEMCRYERI